MWTLWIISTVIGLNEPKVTRYDMYDDKATCYHAWEDLTAEFTDGETAFCEQTVIEKKHKLKGNL